jgi:hypothetical protein
LASYGFCGDCAGQRGELLILILPVKPHLEQEIYAGCHRQLIFADLEEFLA